MAEVQPVNTGQIAKRAAQLAAPLAQRLGLTLWDVRFIKEGANWFLRFWIDKPGGVDLDDCEALSHALDAPLDAVDWIRGFYSLEVCSPGIERELTRSEHFAQYCGARVSAKRVHPPQVLEGRLQSYDPETKTLTLVVASGEALVLPRTQLAWVRLYDDYNELQTLDDDETTAEHERMDG